MSHENQHHHGSFQQVVGEIRRSQVALLEIARDLPESANDLISSQREANFDALMATALDEVSVLRNAVDSITLEMFILSGRTRRPA